ncbi:MAG: signal peptidase II [Anderseniella sp.]
MLAGVKLKGPLSVMGGGLAVLTYIVDQAHKWYMLKAYDIAANQPVNVMPGFDLVMVWNYGISYGWFASHSQATRWILIGLTLIVCVVLVCWLAQQAKAWVAAAIGLVLGGALANATDRLVHGAVADFFHLYYGSYSWYVFNIADIAIVAGVVALIYDSLTKAEPDRSS